MDLEGLEPVFGRAEGKVESREWTAFLPLIFRLHAADDRTLAFAITDFHDNTWDCTRTTEQLDGMRDDMGIGGSWQEFVDYTRASFMSGNVTLLLGGPASAIGGAGATTGKIVALKSKGMPRITFSLQKLTDSAASDRMSDIAVHCCRSWQNLSGTATTEKSEIERLKIELEAEKARSSALQEQLDNLTGNATKKKKTPSPTVVDVPKPALDVPVPAALPSNEGVVERIPKKATPKARKVAPVSSRMKRKGTVIGGDD